ncbi:unnamed protein product, partial [Polarella glacialis]
MGSADIEEDLAPPLDVHQPKGWRAVEGISDIEALHRTDEWRNLYQLVQKDGLGLQNVPPAIRGDREMVAEACWENGLALQYAPEELRGDWEIVLCAVSRSGTALMWASPELRGARE